MAPPSQFGAPPSQFGGPQPSPFAAPPAAYGTQSWPSPGKSRGTPKWVKVLAGAFAFLVLCVVGLHWYDAANARHVGTLPPALQDASLDETPQTEAALAGAQASLARGAQAHGVSHIQLAVYRNGTTSLVALVADIKANSSAFRDQLLNAGANSASVGAFTSVSPGPQGGSESCAVTAAEAACVWADDGTMGMVSVPHSDQATAMAYLQALRDSTEH